MIVNCTSPTGTTPFTATVSGEYQWTITRTSSGCRLTQQRTDSPSPPYQWRHDVYSWRHCVGLIIYVSTAWLTVHNCCVSLSCHSTWSACGTALKRHVVRLSSVTGTRARHSTSGNVRWVNWSVLSSLHTCNYFIMSSASMQWLAYITTKISGIAQQKAHSICVCKFWFIYFVNNMLKYLVFEWNHNYWLTFGSLFRTCDRLFLCIRLTEFI